MDNISHTLMSIGLGATMAQHVPSPWRRACVWTAVIAGNLPDIDIVTTVFSQQSKLVYLLHHRGHTHTIPYVLLTGLLVGWIAWQWQRKSLACVGATPRTVLLITGVLGASLHLGMDWWNSYGVHPFYPFDNRWYYGDAVFIVEPLIWASLLPFCFRLSKTVRYRLLVALVALFGFGLAVVFETYFVAVLFPAWLALGFWWDQARPQQKPGLILCSLVIAAFFTGSFAAVGPASEPPSVPETATLLDAGLTPAPGNPFCWKFLTVSTDSDDYVVRSGTISHLPSLVNPKTCFPARGGDVTADYTSIESVAPTTAIHGEFRIAISELRALMENCEFQAFTLFTRMPFLGQLAGKRVFGDLRFDSEPGLGFSEFEWNSDANCKGLSLPPWVAPREDVFLRE